uniref:Uncharacterized protein n=2 Tax=unclassified Caudoviricetes TaxID=2788787 RepID=A0A8S5PZ94_9CAUD|nr:MAG TPA: hypothetical protein [Siphoviridae sp. ctkL634]DAE12375.1 MAG TPA: hypothetical protein [Siphoviridae sp. ctG0D7]
MKTFPFFIIDYVEKWYTSNTLVTEAVENLDFTTFFII